MTIASILSYILQQRNYKVTEREDFYRRQGQFVQ